MYSTSTIWVALERRLKEGIWRTREGRDLKISDMTTSHIKNCISFIERLREGNIYTPYIPLFKEELEKREAVKAYANKFYELAGKWLDTAVHSESDVEEAYCNGIAEAFIIVAKSLEKMHVD